MSYTPSQIIQFLYCARFTYFEYVLRIPQYEEKFHKVMRGRSVHEKKAIENTEYLRKKLGVTDKKINQYLTNTLLRGEVDEVLFLTNGTAAPLDYKFAEYKDKVYDTYMTQMICYALLIEENYDLEVNKGYLIYTRSKNFLVEVGITPEDKNKVRRAALAIQHIISENRFPKATRYKKRCLTCTYKNICMQ